MRWFGLFEKIESVYESIEWDHHICDSVEDDIKECLKEIVLRGDPESLTSLATKFLTIALGQAQYYYKEGQNNPRNWKAYRTAFGAFKREYNLWDRKQIPVDLMTDEELAALNKE